MFRPYPNARFAKEKEPPKALQPQQHEPGAIAPGSASFNTRAVEKGGGMGFAAKGCGSKNQKSPSREVRNVGHFFFGGRRGTSKNMSKNSSAASLLKTRQEVLWYPFDSSIGFFPSFSRFRSVGKGDRRRRGAGHGEVHGFLTSPVGLDCRQILLVQVLQKNAGSC